MVDEAIETFAVLVAFAAYIVSPRVLPVLLERLLAKEGPITSLAIHPRPCKWRVASQILMKEQDEANGAWGIWYGIMQDTTEYSLAIVEEGRCYDDDGDSSQWQTSPNYTSWRTIISPRKRALDGQSRVC